MLSSEKVAYLKGLADGLELGQETKQDKLISAIIDVLTAVAADIEALNTNNDDLAAEIDAVSDDLADIERIVYEEFGCCCDDECCCDDDCCCEDGAEDEHECCCGGHHDHDAQGEHECCCGGHHDHEAEGEHECCCGGNHDHEAHGEHECCCGGHHGHLYDITCPGCKNHMTIDDHILAMGKVQCVNCGAMLEFGLEDESEGSPEA